MVYFKVGVKAVREKNGGDEVRRRSMEVNENDEVGAKWRFRLRGKVLADMLEMTRTWKIRAGRCEEELLRSKSTDRTE